MDAPAIHRGRTKPDSSYSRPRRAFPDVKTIGEFDVEASPIPEPTFEYLASLEWIRARRTRFFVAASYERRTLGIASPWPFEEWAASCPSTPQPSAFWTPSCLGALEEGR